MTSAITPPLQFFLDDRPDVPAFVWAAVAHNGAAQGPHAPCRAAVHGGGVPFPGGRVSGRARGRPAAADQSQGGRATVVPRRHLSLSLRTASAAGCAWRPSGLSFPMRVEQLPNGLPLAPYLGITRRAVSSRAYPPNTVCIRSPALLPAPTHPFPHSPARSTDVTSCTCCYGAGSPRRGCSAWQ